jgi:hypothetical protein
MVDQVSSNGIMPVSLTISGKEVFVLNDGDSTHLGNITGFNLGYNGDLDPIGVTRMLPVGGAQAFGQVGFDNSGNWLVVTDKAQSDILVYSMGWNQLPAKPVVTSSASPNTPFSFIFDNHNNLLIVDVNQTSPGSVGPPVVAPTYNGAVSSYKIDRDGSLDTISTVYNGQAAACWIAQNEMQYVFTTNPGSGSISTFMEKDGSGKVSIVNPTAISGIGVIDEGITNDGQFLYALGPKMGVYGFKIGWDGSLTVLNGGSPFNTTGTGLSGGSPYIQGIAVQ